MSSTCVMMACESACALMAPPAGLKQLARPSESEAAKLVVEMLIKLCLFSMEGYCLAIKVCMLQFSIQHHSISVPHSGDRR